MIFFVALRPGANAPEYDCQKQQPNLRLGRMAPGDRKCKVQLLPTDEIPRFARDDRRRVILEPKAEESHPAKIDTVRSFASLRVTPGMQVTAEIHLGTRTVLEYLLSPVQKVTHEAGREK